MSAKRISIVGISGSGKSTFGRELASRTKLPLFHMDALFWSGNWRPVAEDDYLRAHRELIDGDAWIIEGYIDQALSDRVRASDLIIYLDYSGLFCLGRVVRRWIEHRQVSRPELPAEARERLSLPFLWTVLSRAERPAIELALGAADQSKVLRVTSKRELLSALERLNPLAKRRVLTHGGNGASPGGT